ncbi:MAG: helix-turn-helix domain-containing protein [Saccharofermentanales bacterium]
MNLESLNPRMLMINLFPCDPGFCTNDRIAQTPYLLYIHSGRGWFVIDAVRYEAHPGDLFFCAVGRSNTIIADNQDPFILSGIDFLFCSISPPAGDALVDESGIVAGVVSTDDESLSSLFTPVINLSSDDGHDYLIREMIGSYEDSTILSLAYCDSLLKSFILNVVSYRFSGKSVRSEASEVLKYISANSSIGLTIEELARRFNYHPSTINRIVKAAAGMSVKEYQIDIRIKKAKSLLLYSGKSITEIALACGYNDVFFFSRQFKKKTSFLPSAFRKSVTRASSVQPPKGQSGE